MPTITNTTTTTKICQFTCHWDEQLDAAVLDSFSVDGNESEISSYAYDFLVCEKHDEALLIAPNYIKSMDELYENKEIEVVEKGEKATFRFSEVITEKTYHPEPIPEGTPAISNLSDLCDRFCADTPALLNKRIYKGTVCGASISVLLKDGTWLHNGRSGWNELTKETPIEGFSIQTIVEGSDATVDSDTFLVPVAISEVDEWIKDMEMEASDLWHEANGDEAEEEEEKDEYYLMQDGMWIGKATCFPENHKDNLYEGLEINLYEGMELRISQERLKGAIVAVYSGQQQFSFQLDGVKFWLEIPDDEEYVRDMAL